MLLQKFFHPKVPELLLKEKLYKKTAENTDLRETSGEVSLENVTCETFGWYTRIYTALEEHLQLQKNEIVAWNYEILKSFLRRPCGPKCFRKGYRQNFCPSLPLRSMKNCPDAPFRLVAIGIRRKLF